jgi:hypothetical protein
MSEEPIPPTLRLKPRARPDSESSTPQPSSDVSAPSTAETGKLRLRPKLDLSAPDAVAPTVDPLAVDAPVAPAPRTISLKPKVVSDAVPVESAAPVAPVSMAPLTSAAEVEAPKFKLKEKPVETAVRNEASALPPPVQTVPKALPTVIGETPSPFPPPTPSPSSGTADLPPPVPKFAIRAKPLSESAEVAKVAAEDDDEPAPRRSALGRILVYPLALVVLIAAFVAYRKFFHSPTPPPAPVAATPQRPSTPSQTLNDLSSAPARAIAKAKETIAKAEERQSQRTEEVSVDSTPRPVHRTEKPVEKPAAPATSTTQLSPGITATTTAKDVAGDARPEFRNWVAQAKISGVFQGATPRALINNRTVLAGQVVDEVLEITFDGIDPTGKNLVFRDRSGSSVLRKF